MTRKKTILSIGYFPKEVPPQFYTSDFAKYACTKEGRMSLAVLANEPNKSRPFYESSAYTLAEPDNAYRNLELVHPVAYTALVDVVTQNYASLHTVAHTSPISRSKPVYSTQRRRAISPQHSFEGITDEKQKSRAGYGWLLRADVSQFYPSVYTHAVAWAITPKLRERVNWNNGQLLGNKVDKSVRETQARRSQGIPIGNDIAFLLGEIVLSKIDKELSVDSGRAIRWFDDYEIACSSRAEAEEHLSVLQRELANYNLRLNPKKTEIIPLPQPVQPHWKREIRRAAERHLERSACQLGEYFDEVFAIQNTSHSGAALKYALGQLFRVTPKTARDERLSQSAISQCIVTEPGCTQKAVALLSHWKLEGVALDEDVVRRTLHAVLQKTVHRAISSDAAWLLSFCALNRIVLNKPIASHLDACDDGLITLLALLLRQEGLLLDYTAKQLRKKSKVIDLNGKDWLLFYEAHRHGYITRLAEVRDHPLFSELDRQGISFLQSSIPDDAFLTRPGGAPDWVVDRILRPMEDSAGGTAGTRDDSQNLQAFSSVAARIRERLKRLSATTTAELYEALQRDGAVAGITENAEVGETSDDDVDDIFADEEDDGSGY